MYSIHSCHANPEPETICGSLEGVRGNEIYVTTYHQDWLPKFLAMGLHHYQVQCTFKSLDFHVRTSGPEYELPVGYKVEICNYDSQNYVTEVSKIPNIPL